MTQELRRDGTGTFQLGDEAFKDGIHPNKMHGNIRRANATRH
jgi:hypothetical protein